MQRIMIALVVSAGGLASAQTPSTPPPTAAELKELIEQQRRQQDEQNREHAERIRSLEALLGALKSEQEQKLEEDELDELLRLAEASGPPPSVRPSSSPSILNPTISVIPDFTAQTQDIRVSGSRMKIEEAFPGLFEETNVFTLRETEIELRAPVSPEADGVAILAVGDEETAFEEAYITFHSLPWDLSATVGKFLLDFGRANRIHQHDLPQIDRPIAHRLLFGDEGTGSPGISVSKVLFTMPEGGLFPTHSELTVQAINAVNEEAPLFGTETKNQAAANVHWRNFWQVTPNSDFEAGLSFLFTPGNSSGPHEASTVVGTDLTWRWDDPEPGSYDAWLIQAELIGSSVDTGEGRGSVDGLGGYLTVQNQLDSQWYAGVRFDAAQSPFLEDASIWGIAPYVTHYVNEFIRLRFQYNFIRGETDGSSATNHGLSAQLVWVFGAHPPEPYWVNR